MMLLMEVRPPPEQMGAEFGSMGQAIAEACNEGLVTGGKAAAGVVVRDYLSGQSLNRRTGNLARAVDSWPEDFLHVAVGVRDSSAVKDYEWLLGDEEKTIFPKRGRFLAIPIGEALTAAGVPRIFSPREVPEGFFVRTGGRLLFGRKRGNRGKFRPLFTLVKSVFVQGSGALYDGVSASIGDITDAMQAEVNKGIGK
jgi:hypothetical protein